MASRDARAARGPEAPHVTNKSANVHIHGITLRNITATGWKSSKGGNDGSAGWFNCADKVPCTALTLESVHVFRDAAGNSRGSDTGHKWAKVKVGEFTKEAYDEWRAKGGKKLPNQMY